MRFQIPRFPLAAAVLAAAALIVSRGEYPWQRLSDVPTAGPIVVSDPYHTVSDTLQSGETVGALLARHGVIGLDLPRWPVALRFDPRRIRAGQVFSVRRDGAADEATQVEFRAIAEQRLQFIRTAKRRLARRTRSQSAGPPTPFASRATITSNLFNAIDDEVSDATLDRQERANVVYALADVFSYSVDFSRDIQAGDRFAAVVERRTSEEGETRFGRILAGELTVGGKAIAAFNYRNGGQNALLRRRGQRAQARLPRRAGRFPLHLQRPLPRGASTRCSASSAGTRGSTTRPTVARRCAPPPKGRLSARAGRAVTASWSRSATATASPRATATSRSISANGAAGRSGLPGRHHRSRRLDRPLDRPAPALRVPRQRDGA